MSSSRFDSWDLRREEWAMPGSEDPAAPALGAPRVSCPLRAMRLRLVNLLAESAI
jgi:hypothetical protein